jgi:hypothetical protein
MFTKKEVTTMTVDGFVIENGVAVGYEYCTDFGVSVSFPEEVRIVGENLFCGNRQVRSVSFMWDVIAIEDCAFQSCTGIKTLKFPTSLQKIGDLAFEYCEGLQSVVFFGGVAFHWNECLF